MDTRKVGGGTARRATVAAWGAWVRCLVAFVVILASGIAAERTAFAGPAPAQPSAAVQSPTAPQTRAPEATPEPDLELGASDTRSSDAYGERIQTLRTDVDALKDKVFRSKARLSLLRETVLRGMLSGSRVILAHRNLMGTGFRLVRVVYRLDGAQIFARTDETGSLDAEDEVVIFDGNLSAGPHDIEIELHYSGHGYGIFAYLTEYTFESKSGHAFTAPEEGAVKVLSVGYEEGNLTTEMADRPNVSWQVMPLDASGRPLKRARSADKPKKKSVR